MQGACIKKQANSKLKAKSKPYPAGRNQARFDYFYSLRA